MNVVLTVIGTYLLVGLVVCIVFDLVTKRIRNRISQYSFDTQQVTGGNHTFAIIITLLATWIFFPALIIGACKKSTVVKE